MPRRILRYPDPRLREVAEPITKIDDYVRELAQEMIGLMKKKDGCGLAGPQVGEALRIFVIDTSEEQNDPKIFINPEIDWTKGEFQSLEGCLSFPGCRCRLKRATELGYWCQDLDGSEREEKAAGKEAIAIQHELDHLDGLLFIDRVDAVDRQKLKGYLKRLEKVPLEKDLP